MSTTNKKAILLVRVSSEEQDYAEQEKDLYKLAYADGFTDDNIIPICEKESGIKLTEDERKGLTQMKSLISEGNISTVYAWEVSRIARKKSVLFSVIDYLTKNHIQLVIYDPYIKLLNPDNTVNDSAEIVLTLFGQLAESEMRNKKARFRRTRIANAKAGKWNGGSSIKYGYDVDENGYYLVNEQEAEVIRKAFELYTTTNMGMTKVTNELVKLGYDINYHRVSRILPDELYTGRTVRKNMWLPNDDKTSARRTKTVKGLELHYPAIISEEIYEEAKKRREKGNMEAYKGTSYYFGRGLMKCPECGNAMIAEKQNGYYCCNSYSHRANRGGECRCKLTVGINFLDTVLWDATVSEFISANRFTKQEKINAAQAKIEDCEKILANIQQRLDKLTLKSKRYAKLYGELAMDDDEYEASKLQIQKERNDIERERVSAEEKIKQLTKVIENQDNATMLDQILSLSEEAFGINELREMCEMVHQYIESVKAEQDKRTKIVTVKAFSGAVYRYKYRYAGGYGGKNGVKWWRGADEIIMQSLSEWVEFTPSIIIKRNVGHYYKRNLMDKDFEIIKNGEPGAYNVPTTIDDRFDRAKGLKAMTELSERLSKK